MTLIFLARRRRVLSSGAEAEAEQQAGLEAGQVARRHELTGDQVVRVNMRERPSNKGSL